MLGVTHGVSGAAAGAWFAVACSARPGVAISGTVVATAAAMLPDLDHLDAAPTRAFEMFRFRLGLRLGSWVLINPRTVRIGLGPLVARLIRLVSRLTTGRAHRGWSHSLAFAALVGVLVGAVSVQWLPVAPSVYLAVSASLGVVAALLGDLVTASGLNHLLWPCRTKVSIPRAMRIDTGGWVEVFFVRPAVTALTVIGLGLILTGGGSV